MWSVITRWLAASIHPQTKRAAAARLSSAAPVSCPLNRSPRGPLASALVTIIAALPLGTEMTSSLIALPLGKTDPHVAPSQTGEPGLYEAFYQSPVSGINKVQVADSPAHPQTRSPTNTPTHKHAHPQTRPPTNTLTQHPTCISFRPSRQLAVCLSLYY